MSPSSADLSGSSTPVGFELATADLAPATGVRTTRFCRTRPVFAKRLRRAKCPSVEALAKAEASFVLRACVAHEVQPALRPPLRADALASTTSHPAFVTTRDRPSCRNRTGRIRPLIWDLRELECCPSCQSAATRRATGCCPVPFGRGTPRLFYCVPLTPRLRLQNPCRSKNTSEMFKTNGCAKDRRIQKPRRQATL